MKVNPADPSQPVEVIKTTQSPIADFPVASSGKLKLEDAHYIICNEGKQGETLAELSQSEAPDNSVHLGFSCWFNLDVIATRHPSYAVIGDVDPNIIALLDIIEEKVGQCDTKEQFLQAFWDDLSNREDLVFYLLGPDGMLDFNRFSDFVSKQGWMQSTDNYAVIKDMYKEGRIIHRKLDITDKENMESIKGWAEKNNLKFDTLYASNIQEWLKNNRKLDEMKHFEALADANTYGISAFKENPMRGAPQQHLKRGGIPELQYNKKRKRSSIDQ